MTSTIQVKIAFKLKNIIYYLKNIYQNTGHNCLFLLQNVFNNVPYCARNHHQKSSKYILITHIIKIGSSVKNMLKTDVRTSSYDYRVAMNVSHLKYPFICSANSNGYNAKKWESKKCATFISNA